MAAVNPPSKRDDGLARLRANVPRITFAVMLVALAVAIALDWNRMKPALHAANWSLLPFCLLSAFLSYACGSGSYTLVNRALGLRASRARLFLTGFINMAANNLLPLAGVAGYSTSAVLLGEGDIPQRDILAASLFNSYLYVVSGVTFIPLSLVALLLTHGFPDRTRIALLTLACALALMSVLAFLLVFRARFRTRALNWLGRVASRLTRRDFSSAFARFENTLDAGLSLLGRRPGRLALLLSLLVLDWLFTIATLFAAFRAFGVAVSPGVVLSGFFVGISAGALSMIPGGVGVQDASMAGIFVLLGVALEPALLATILFRTCYYFVPFGAALLGFGLARKR
jgi:uncharacterized protein (TIRG00374 family)